MSRDNPTAPCYLSARKRGVLPDERSERHDPQRSCRSHRRRFPPECRSDLRELVIANAGEADLADVRVILTGEPGFLAPLTLRINRIAAGATHRLPTPDLVLDAGFLRSIAEGLRGSLAITVLSGETVVAQDTVAVELLPPSHWGGSGAAPELLAAFVQPNDPAIDVLLRDAAAQLAAAGKPAAIDGYTGGTRQRVRELASAIWAAVAARGLAYVMPPASFERAGQKATSWSSRPGRTSSTNLVINTSLRTYHMELRSTAATYMASVSWQYPQDQLIALRRQNAAAEAAQPVATGVDLARLNFRYAIDGDSAPWRPLRAFDDGRQVFIEFPRGIAQGCWTPRFFRLP